MPRDSLPSGLLDSCPIEWSHPLNRGLVGWWAGWPNSGWSGGATVRDAVGLSGKKSSNGTLLNGTTWRGGPNGLRSFSFDGSDDYIAADVVAAEANFWVAMWVRPNGTGNSGLAGTGTGFEGTGWYTQYSEFGGREIKIVTNQSGISRQTISISGALVVGEWARVLFLVRGTSGRIFVNGNEVTYSSSGTHVAPASATDLRFGRYPPGGLYFNGFIGDVRLANGAYLSPPVLAELDYDQSRRGNPDTLRWLRPWSFGVEQGGGGGGTYTGTGALTSSSATLAASATFATATYTGTGSLTSVSAELAASATFSVPVYTGTSALTSTSAELAASATVTNPTYTGTGTLTSQSATLAASAVFATAVYQGTGTLTSGSATLAASATFVGPTYTGTGTLTSASAQLTASATVTNPSYTGTGALASTSAELAASAVFASGVFQGTGALTSSSATLAASATFVGPTYTGTAALTSGSATLSASALFAMAIYQATATLTSGSAVLAASATFTAPVSTTGGYVRARPGGWARVRTITSAGDGGG